MNFRQRLAWLAVCAYLAASFGIFYYIFEISERYNAFALEHVESYHGQNTRTSYGLSQVTSLFRHVTDIPLPLWIMLLALPYLQVFCVLVACTKPEPRLSFALTWPGLLIIKCRRLYRTFSGMETSGMKPHASTMLNGHVVDA